MIAHNGSVLPLFVFDIVFLVIISFVIHVVCKMCKSIDKTKSLQFLEILAMVPAKGNFS